MARRVTYRSRLGLAAILLIAVGAGCRRQERAVTEVALAGATMGTRYHIRLTTLPPGSTAEELQHEIDDHLATINGRMSTYVPDSELSQFNRFRGAEWFAVSTETATVVAAALDVSRRSRGAFDVTVGPLVNLWNFGPDPQSARVPTDDQIAAARSDVGWQLLEVRHKPPALRKRRPGVYVDLSAIAKGFAVDEIARLCAGHGIAGYMIEIGGEVRTQGRKRDGSGWRIGVEEPVPGVRALHTVVELEDAALATSGDYRNFFEAGGRRFSHEIDPRTGRPIAHALASVSVLAADCMRADAWATALIVLGSDEAFQVAVEERLDVLLLIRTPTSFEERATPGFARHVRR